MGCTREGICVPGGGVTTLVFMGGTTTTNYPTIRVCLVLEALEEISTQNGPFNFDSNSMSSCVSQ